MSEKVLWLFTFVALYWVYCIFWGLACASGARTANDFFIAGRRLSPWVFVLAVTATSFTGLTIMGDPGLVYHDGFQYAGVAFAAIAIPFTGVLFLKRLWLLGKRFGYVTPGEMLSDYFRGETIRVLVLIVAGVFSIPFVGIQLGISGFLVGTLSDGIIDRDVAMWVLAAVLVMYVSLGGLRAVAYVGTLQCLLLAAGAIATGAVAYGELGGFGALNEAMARLGATDIGTWGRTAQGYNAYFTVPGVIQFTAGLGREMPVGGLWTGVMTLTYMLALMGVQSSPVFTMWAFGSRDPKPFAPQQVWATGGVIGFILIFFVMAQGMGAHFLGATPAVNQAGLTIKTVLPDLTAGNQFSLVPHYINLLADKAPWFVGLLAVCALAAMQAMVAAYASSAGAMLTRDLYKRFLNPMASHATQILSGRVCAGLVVLASLMVASFARESLVQLGGLALAFGFQLWPALAAVCWFPWITGQAASLGIVTGFAAVILTENLGASLAQFVGIELPWGRWPWTIHSAAWGMFFNAIVCVIVSLLTQSRADRQRRATYHDFLAEHARLPSEKLVLRPVAWGIVLGWAFFAVGPGAVIGNDVFGTPNGGSDAWNLGVPSIWAWQVLWWALGVLMLWFLAYKMELSTFAGGRIEALSGDIGDTPAQTRALDPKDLRVRWQWFWAAIIGGAGAIFVNWAFG